MFILGVLVGAVLVGAVWWFQEQVEDFVVRVRDRINNLFH